jgi:hypothetical protein
MDEMGGQADRHLNRRHAAMEQRDRDLLLHPEQLGSARRDRSAADPNYGAQCRKEEKKKEGKGIISDQLEIRDYRLSITRLEPGGRADGVVVFDRPNFKESTEKLFLQIAQADQVDRPILIRLPFTPPISSGSK